MLRLKSECCYVFALSKSVFNIENLFRLNESFFLLTIVIRMVAFLYFVIHSSHFSDFKRLVGVQNFDEKFEEASVKNFNFTIVFSRRYFSTAYVFHSCESFFSIPFLMLIYSTN